MLIKFKALPMGQLIYFFDIEKNGSWLIKMGDIIDRFYPISLKILYFTASDDNKKI